MYGCSYDVLVGNTHIGTPTSIFFASHNGTVGRSGDGSDEHRVAFGFNGLPRAIDFGTTSCVSSRIDHVDLLVATHAGYRPIVANTDEQSSAIGIGEGRDAMGNLAHGGYLVFEILLLMFALGDEFAQAVLGFHFSFDVMVFWKARRGSPLARWMMPQ